MIRKGSEDEVDIEEDPTVLEQSMDDQLRNTPSGFVMYTSSRLISAS